MVTIRILDHVEAAYSFDHGETIRKLIEPALDKNEAVTISFERVVAASSSFVNAAFVKLLDRFPYEVIAQHLKIVKSNSHINELILSRMETARRKPILNSA